MNRILFLLLIAAMLGGVAVAAGPGDAARTPLALPAASAVGLRLDTLLIGGYASGSFRDAVHVLKSDLTAEERSLIGQHLERIFAESLPAEGLGRSGRLRVAYERALRPDGTPRAIRVLGAEVAVAGRVQTAYFFEREGRPGYFDAFGRSLVSERWAGPLPALRVTSSFADRRVHPILGRALPHTGVDFAASIGDPVRVTADGIVASAGRRGGYGLLVELQHPNGYTTRYAHLSRIAEDIGPARLVRQGDLLGFVGMSGMATAPHLHYEVRRRGRPLDPMRMAADDLALPSMLGDERWAQERRELTTLLARAPTVLRARF